jgi:hypothetical protein
MILNQFVSLLSMEKEHPNLLYQLHKSDVLISLNWWEIPCMNEFLNTSQAKLLLTFLYQKYYPSE